MVGAAGWAWKPLALGYGRRRASFVDKAYKIGPTIDQMQGVDDLYKALVVEWAIDETPALGASRLPLTMDAMVDQCEIGDVVHRMMLFNGVTYLPDDILTKVDRAAMAVSLETRVPSLDHRVAVVAWRLPMSMKIRDGQRSWRRGKSSIATCRRNSSTAKGGFAAPVGKWVRGALNEWGSALLEEERLRKEGFLDAVAVTRMWSQHCSGTRDWTHRLWNPLTFQAWWELQCATPAPCDRDGLRGPDAPESIAFRHDSKGRESSERSAFNAAPSRLSWRGFHRLSGGKACLKGTIWTWREES